MNKNANNSIRVPTPTLNMFTSLTNPKKPKEYSAALSTGSAFEEGDHKCLSD